MSCRRVRYSPRCPHLWQYCRLGGGNIKTCTQFLVYYGKSYSLHMRTCTSLCQLCSAAPYHHDYAIASVYTPHPTCPEGLGRGNMTSLCKIFMVGGRVSAFSGLVLSYSMHCNVSLCRMRQTVIVLHLRFWGCSLHTHCPHLLHPIITA